MMLSGAFYNKITICENTRKQFYVVFNNCFVGNYNIVWFCAVSFVDVVGVWNRGYVLVSY